VSGGLEREEFELHYQPIVDLGEGEPTGFEALIRWDHGEHGVLQARDFIPAAERSGVIREIDQWVVGQACSQLDRWASNSGDEAPFVAVNISRVNLAEPQFGARVAEVLEGCEVDVAELRVEITETAMDRDHAVVGANVERIAETGVPIWLDDFGVGAASMQSLKRLPVSGIKVDREFLVGGDEVAGAGVFEALVEMGRILDLEIVAEGIETEGELERARAAGCEWGQGYLFSKSVAACEVPTLRNRCGGVFEMDD
jgi:EAL domain-containing protein (putative c-di-GMP-specific phosphodiesterase class I)